MGKIALLRLAASLFSPLDAARSDTLDLKGSRRITAVNQPNVQSCRAFKLLAESKPAHVSDRSWSDGQQRNATATEKEKIAAFAELYSAGGKTQLLRAPAGPGRADAGGDVQGHKSLRNNGRRQIPDSPSSGGENE